MLFNLVLISLIFLIKAEDKIIEQIYYITKKGYTITFDVGDPRQYMEKSIDQALTYTWTTPIFFRPNNSQTLRKGPIKELNLLNLDTFEFFIGEIYIDRLYSRINVNDSFLIDNYPFFYIKDVSIHRWFDEGYAFGLKYENESFSIVHNLYNNRKISHLIYSLGETNNTNGTLYLGGIPSIVNDYNKGSCKVNESYISWGCHVEQVIFSRYNKKSHIEITEHILNVNNTYGYFQASKKYIYAPKYVIDYLIDKVFQSFISSSFCSYTEKGFFDVSISCNCEVIYQMPNISFVIGGYKYHFDAFYLFQYYEDSLCDFLITSTKDRGNHWIFGYSFFNKFISVFDYEKKEISFYSKLPRIIAYNERYSYQKVYFIIINITLMLGIIINIIIRIKFI